MSEVSTNFLDYVDYTKPSFLHALVCIVIAPIIWNTIARLEFYTRFLTKITTSPYVGCYLLALWIFSFSLYRDFLFGKALDEQATHPELQSDLIRGVAAVLFVSGTTFVLSSMWALGVTGTYLGDYFGILMDKMVTGFPFNILDNPMYIGSTMCFLAHSLWRASPAGLVLTVVVYAVYRVALLFEEPFTAYIYAQREQKRKSGKAAAAPKAQKAKPKPKNKNKSKKN
ncbi:Phospholipid methyltransferase [Acanthamoeba castellanii str. Neff]|uniref:Phosphatidylethanolamine N-methyltransferase n=1 Tax=Acanthamoeba castellanii (strain ATCC 30010 / Neff) TaxID=1257118 RepID=L8GIT0_ACACF|nr:Phospholipid methyltransferase [Acanthamoeba castellanii str. Neff]ELR12643.1 Phospholipid methyltransferase [Acanthamoeba castellanii str. Neff]